MFYSESGTDLETLMTVDQGAQQDRVDGGSSLIAERLADRVRAAGGDIRLRQVVRTIDHNDEGVTVTTRAGADVVADNVIVALPPTLAGRLEYVPALPSRRDQLTQRVPAGSVVKRYLVYERSFWRGSSEAATPLESWC